MWEALIRRRVAVDKKTIIFKMQVMLLNTWDSSRDEKRSNVGYRHQIPQQIKTKPYSNAIKV